MKNVTNEEKVKWLKENCYCSKGDEIDLSNLDFGGSTLDFTGIKAKYIDNSNQEAERIHNSEMKSQIISNGYQVASEFICNDDQKAGKFILNGHQVIETRLWIEQYEKEKQNLLKFYYKGG